MFIIKFIYSSGQDLPSPNLLIAEPSPLPLSINTLNILVKALIILAVILLPPITNSKSLSFNFFTDYTS